MKTLSTLKTLPLIGLLAMGLALTPVVSMADDDDRGRGKDRTYQKHDGGKGHYRDGGKSHRRDKGQYNRGHGQNKGYAKGHNKGHNKGYAKSHNKGHSKGYAKGHNKGRKHVYNYGSGHGYAHHGHTHQVYRPHTHVEQVVVHDYHGVYDPFRLMLGLHLDNIDIIYRDF